MGERGVREVQRLPGFLSWRPASAARPAWSVHGEARRGEAGASKTQTQGHPRTRDPARGRCPAPAGQRFLEMRKGRKGAYNEEPRHETWARVRSRHVGV